MAQKETVVLREYVIPAMARCVTGTVDINDSTRHLEADAAWGGHLIGRPIHQYAVDASAVMWRIVVYWVWVC